MEKFIIQSILGTYFKQDEKGFGGLSPWRSDAKRFDTAEMAQAFLDKNFPVDTSLRVVEDDGKFQAPIIS